MCVVGNAWKQTIFDVMVDFPAVLCRNSTKYVKISGGGLSIMRITTIGDAEKIFEKAEKAYKEAQKKAFLIKNSDASNGEKWIAYKNLDIKLAEFNHAKKAVDYLKQEKEFSKI